MKTNSLNFRTILVATDLRENHSPALRYAQAIASQHGSSLVILYVIDPVGYAFPSGSPQLLEANLEARNELKRVEDDIRSSGITVHSVVESGVICERILQAVKDHNADLLILGTKARTSAGRVALGTVARRLLAGCSCPILTVPPGAEAMPATAGCWRRVLVATDFSAASLAALECAHAIVRGQLLVLHAIGAENKQESALSLEKFRLLAPLNESHTFQVEYVPAAGDVGELIAQRVLSFGPDLILLGAPSSELNSNTVVEVVSEAMCPVLCVPATGGTTLLLPEKEEVSA